MGVGITVSLCAVGKKYRNRTIFDGIDALVEPGGCLAVTGRNGSGKSTLLKIIAGLEQPSAGRIDFSREAHVLKPAERMSHIGMVSPEIMLYHTLTGVENLLFFARLRGIQPSSPEMNEWFEMVGLGAERAQIVGNYSTGMRQRLKFAVLLALNPSVWLLDEPSSNLDASGKDMVAGVIAAALQRQVTVFIATNEQWEAENAGQKIFLA